MSKPVSATAIVVTSLNGRRRTSRVWSSSSYAHDRATELVKKGYCKMRGTTTYLKKGDTVSVVTLVEDPSTEVVYGTHK